MSDHGYGRYTNGCRCGICRAAKAEYMRIRRRRSAAERRLAERRGERYVVRGITHGAAGYNEFSCRCRVCRVARKSSPR